MAELSTYEKAILNNAIKIIDKEKGKQKLQSPFIKKMLTTLEKWIKIKKLVCYGGTAINNILPEKQQFYDKESELPDYDVFSSNAIQDIKEIADIYASEGYTAVEAKAGMHLGTYKLYINFIPILDLTEIDNIIFNNI